VGGRAAEEGMAMSDLPSGNSFVKLVMAASAAALVSGCGAVTRHAGIDLTPGAAEPALQALAREAWAGNKAAQLELGIRYEEGRGVPQDLKRAARLYASASRRTEGRVWSYTPAVSRVRGQVLPVRSGPTIPGLPEAAERLASLRRTD